MKQNFVPALRFSFLTPCFDFFMKYLFPDRKVKEDLVALASTMEGRNILDFGCGTGTLSIMLKEALPAVTVTSVDVDDQALEIARKKVFSKGLAIDFDSYSGSELPYQTGLFDAAFASLVFHHLEDKAKHQAFRELVRVLKPGGRLFLADFDRSENPLLRASFAVIRRFDGERITRANARGLIPDMAAAAGFTDLARLRRYRSIFGEMSIVTGVAMDRHTFSG